ncbi:MAG: hypothetical protein ACOC9O_02035 [Myxococcota bacterium]
MSKRREGKSGDRNTVRGFGTSSTLERRDSLDGPPPAAPVRGAAEPTSEGGHEGAIEIEAIRESGSPRLLEGRWRAYEVWTVQHIYVLADDLECIEIIGRSSGKAEKANEILGARLVGGEMRDADGCIRQVSHPLPQPGARAVFAKRVGERQRMSETSAVTRVVLRQRVVTISPTRSERPSWRNITGRHDLP